ncbi:MAG: hypothetical protein OK454_02570 [Thaumarchaeota archaeon]|nr:hypothetical protein [Nitrososphaerota archaeon]
MIVGKMAAHKASAVADEPIEVLFALHNKFNLMDLVGPVEVLSHALHDLKDESAYLPCSTYLTSPWVTSPYLTSPYLASPYLASPYLASPYLASNYLTFPHLTLTRLALPSFPQLVPLSAWEGYIAILGLD